MGSPMKKQPKVKKKSKTPWFIILFVFAFWVYVVLGWNIFPRLDDGTVNVPVWYMMLSFPVCCLISLIMVLIKNCISRISDYIDHLGRRFHVSNDCLDSLYKDAVSIVIQTNNATASILQRKLNISFDNAKELIDRMETNGIVGPFLGTIPRQILVGKEKPYPECKAYLAKAKPNILLDIEQIKQIIQDENEWRRGQKGLSSIEAEFEEIDKMEGQKFESWCANFLQKIGFINVEVTQGSGDQGVDILAEKDGIKYAIQCKCYSSDLGNKPIQEVNTGKAIYHCQIGAVMTNRYFTSGGKEAAAATGVLLWDRDWIQEKLEETGT